MAPITIGQLRAMPTTVDLMTAASALGLGRTKAYELARRGQFPCRVIRIGDTYRIPTAGLLDLLGISQTDPASPPGNPSPEPPPPGAPDLAASVTQMTQHHPGPPTGFPGHRGRAGGTPAVGPQNWLGHQAARRRELVIVGAHGGAGTTTLAILLQPVWDMGAMRPGRDARYPAIIAHGQPLLLVCRNTPSATAAATTAAAALTRQGAHVVALIVVSDGWPEPPAATARLRLMEPRAGAIVRVPFIPALRLADDPAAVPLPRRAQRALDRIRVLAGRAIPAR